MDEYNHRVMVTGHTLNIEIYGGKEFYKCSCGLLIGKEYLDSLQETFLYVDKNDIHTPNKTL